MSNPSQQITDLVDRLTRANDAYRNGSPIMSDAAYDALEDQLRALDQNHAFLSKVGAAPTSGWAKARHGRPMASLNKAQAAHDLKSWAASCSYRPGEVLIVMDKLDGASLNVEYKGGQFVRAVTRGDGEIGEDITTNARLMPFPKVIPGGFTGSLRGEVIVRYGEFQAHFPGQSNPRNTANGTMKRQSDAAGCRHLDVVMFDVLPDSGDPDSKMVQFRNLAAWGFSVPRWAVATSVQGVEDIYADYLANVRSSVDAHTPGNGKIDYDIDGLVIQFDDHIRFDALGSLGRGPKGAVAWKFEHEEKETILRDIVWQVGNSGRITPVAVFDPVVVGGTEVKRATLHNVPRLKELRLFKGARILVSKRNDVIPAVEANLDEGIVV